MHTLPDPVCEGVTKQLSIAPLLCKVTILKRFRSSYSYHYIALEVLCLRTHSLRSLTQVHLAVPTPTTDVCPLNLGELLIICNMHAGHSMLAESLATVSLCLLFQQALGHRILTQRDAATQGNALAAPQQTQPVASNDGTKSNKSTVVIAAVCVTLIGSLVLYGCYRMWKSGNGMRALKPRCGHRPIFKLAASVAPALAPIRPDAQAGSDTVCTDSKTGCARLCSRTEC